jgi:hypothetical protein
VVEISVSSRLPAIAAKLAAALRLTPCSCNYAGSWPTFKAEACVGEKSKHKLFACNRCKALEEYDAFVSIIQTPGIQQGAAKQEKP